MIGKKYFCDCCHQEVLNPKEFYRIRVKSKAFVNYVNFDSLGANMMKFDICKNCIDEFKEYMQRMEEK